MDIEERSTMSAIESAVTHLSSQKLALIVREFQKEIKQLKEEKEALRLGYNEVMGKLTYQKLEKLREQLTS